MRLLNFRLLDGTGRDDARASLTIGDDGRIANVTRGAGPPAEPGDLDLSGHTVLPGLFDCHVHLVADASTNPFDTSRGPASAHFGILGAVNARRLLRRGITTARDLGAHHFTDLAIKRAIESGLIPGPRLLTSGKILTMTGGHGWLFGQEVDGVDEVRKYARLNLKMGADNIKMVASGGVLTPGVNPRAASLSEEELAAGFAEAAKAGKLSAAHAQSNAGIKNAIRAGVRTIEHGFWLDEEACQMMIDRDVYLSPTLAAMRCMLERTAELPAFIVDKVSRFADDHFASFALAQRLGVKIVCGTDAGTPFNYHGEVVVELLQMTELGMSPMDALVAATQRSAEALRLDGVTGTVAAGKAADLLVVKGDPLQNLRILREPAFVFKEGWQVSPEKLDLEVPKQKLLASDLWAAAEKFLAQGCACC